MQELQRNVLAGSFGFLSSFASFTGTNRSRRFGDRRKAKKGTYLKMLFSVRWIAEWVHFLSSSLSWMLGRTGL